jgi:hypothetical protein
MPQSERAQNRGDVILDGSLGQKQLRCDFAVGRAVSDRVENVALGSVAKAHASATAADPPRQRRGRAGHRAVAFSM